MSLFDAAIAAFDAENALDPNHVPLGGELVAKELAYARRMSLMLVLTYPDASEPLRLAARCQHIRRWDIPRLTYPQGRAGYLAWRNRLKQYHAEVAARIMHAAGYDAAIVDRVGQLLRKERLKQDADAQRLEDIACLVFLEDHLADFAPKHDEAKVIGIIAKTWPKMSPEGQRAAMALDLAPEGRRLVEIALTSKGN